MSFLNNFLSKENILLGDNWKNMGKYKEELKLLLSPNPNMLSIMSFGLLLNFFLCICKFFENEVGSITFIILCPDFFNLETYEPLL